MLIYSKIIAIITKKTEGKRRDGTTAQTNGHIGDRAP